MYHLEKGPGKEGSPIGNYAEYFSCYLYTIGKLWTKFQLYKKIFPQTMVFSVRLPDYQYLSRIERLDAGQNITRKIPFEFLLLVFYLSTLIPFFHCLNNVFKLSLVLHNYRLLFASRLHGPSIEFVRVL